MLDLKTKIKIAYWYYKVGMTQEQIGQRLRFSRQRVNKIINSLVDDGVVSIVINGLEHEYMVLESELEQRFSLQQAIIADAGQGDIPLTSVLGKKAARFLDDYIQDGKKIGVSWGTTLGETISYMRSGSKSKCHVVQLVGGLNTSNHVIKPDEIARLLAGKLNCDYSILYAPAFLHNEEARQVLIQEEMFKNALEQIGNCDMAVVGIGQLDSNATIVSQGYLDRESYEYLKYADYVGDICFNHFKLNGEFDSLPFQKRVMGVDIPTLQKNAQVIAIAGGKDKAWAVLGALNTGCIDILITDSLLVNELLKIDSMNREKKDRWCHDIEEGNSHSFI